MPDRIASDNPAVETATATIGRYGGTTRPQIELPEGVAERVPVGEVVRLAVDGTEYRARIEESGGAPVIRGAYETPRLARTPGEGENHLVAWLDQTDLDIGRSVYVDIVEAGYAYGLREPGTTAYYDATEKPSDSLAAIARDLDG
ncbi:hypothetical protein [Salarchaeum sp. JOR-1]|uniref:DUF7112 family protein n=1 Tax=Salarchaeum sp. JOR-1 TaxID=2599399 RepID=UPI001198326E|nr:hypothetical protein [Salarchaeum sp. JOR-1]QDX39605.1 hypothetical protein FQU85_01375 [Salarchaeum sp. JOR-1]